MEAIREMLPVFFWIIIGMLILLSIMQLIFVWMYRRRLRKKPTQETVIERFRPRVAVLLAVRGEDPTLVDCLTGLCIQSYSNYELHVVADDAQDPGLKLVTQFFEDPEYSKIKKQIHLMEEHPTSRSLKCSALIHSIGQFDESIEVVALVDADVVADPNWISDLIRPLEDPAVGASTGNRWFAPKDKNVGSLVRQAWNAGALPQMMLYNIPWGGSLAIKISTIEECKLLDSWATAFCEDTLMPECLKQRNLKIVRVPNLIVANEESTSWTHSIDWIARQLLTVRLHNPNWPLVAAHGLIIGACLAGALIIGLALIIFGYVIYGVVLIGSLLIMELIFMGLFDWIRNGNEKITFERGAQRTSSRLGVASVLLRIVATQVAYVMAVWKALTARRVSWRGIEYEIHGKSIKMKQYRPYRDVENGPHKNVDQSID